MKRLRKMWEDISRGENIDLYVTVLVAILLAVLNVIGMDLQYWITPLTLAVLALLAYSMLGNRYRIDEMRRDLAKSSEGVLLKKWPEDNLSADLKKTKDLLLIGVSLKRTVRENYSLLEEKLRQGDSIRILVSHPEQPGSEIAANRVRANVNIQRTRYGIETTLDSLCKLKETKLGALRIRAINSPLSFGGFVMDPESPKGILYLEYYTFKMVDEDIPKFVFRPEDKYWYEFFATQAETLWNSVEDWSCRKSQHLSY